MLIGRLKDEEMKRESVGFLRSIRLGWVPLIEIPTHEKVIAVGKSEQFSSVT